MIDQFRGCLLGLAVGDALGTPVERLEAAEVQSRHGKVREMLGGGYLHLAPGGVTEETELMLAVLDSYIETRHFDPIDVAERFLAWYRSGPREIDGLTREACENLLYGYNFERAGYDAWQAMPDSMRQGSASLPRGAPTGLLHYHDHIHLIGESRVVSGITHYDERCKLACVCFNLAIAHLLLVGAEGLLDELLEFIEPRNTPLAYSLRAVSGMGERDLRSTPHVLDALQSSLWAAIYCTEFEEGLTLLAGRGGDAGTICATAGALLGARFGADAIPERWLKPLQYRERIDSGARQLFELCEES